MTADRAGPVADAAADTLRAIVVTYNTRELALPLLGDLLEELRPWPGSDVVVVDNASTDGTAEAIAAAYPNVRLEASPKNLGFGPAVNLAARGATSRWLLLVNPDARIDAGSVARLVDVAKQQSGHGLYGGKFVDIVRQTAEDSVAELPSVANLVGFATGIGAIGRRLGWRSAPRRAAAATEPTAVDALPGTFVLIERDAWHAVGGFDERYFMYSEDLDLSLRITKTGRRPMYVPAASIQHAGGASSSSGSKEVLKLRSLVTLLRAQWSARRARTGEALLLAGIAVRRLARLRAGTPDGRWETAWRERRRWRSGW
ncbi:MAG: N-acetylglucosaminyl-diphospho-decaprenol L-rhamnosyltransferase [Actinomycetota bacterium]|nr:N-acetylglucosaminyl-diphospho-decaprenol L-rhamnosyltransferase [Actinomycetota bacterium]